MWDVEIHAHWRTTLKLSVKKSGNKTHNRICQYIFVVQFLTFVNYTVIYVIVKMYHH